MYGTGASDAIAGFVTMGTTTGVGVGFGAGEGPGAGTGAGGVTDVPEMFVAPTSLVWG